MKLIDKVKNLFVEVKFMNIKDEAGLIFQAEEFVEGADIMVVAEDGTLSPAPDGTYVIPVEDKYFNLVIAGGKIVSFLEKIEEEMKSETPATTPTTEVPKTIETSNTVTEVVKFASEKDMNDIVSELMKHIKDLKAELDTFKSETATIKTEFAAYKASDSTKPIVVPSKLTETTGKTKYDIIKKYS